MGERQRKFRLTGMTVADIRDTAISGMKEFWVNECRNTARVRVYTPEVLEPITVAYRAGGGEIQPNELTESYLKGAGEQAQVQAYMAAVRLAKILE